MSSTSAVPSLENETGARAGRASHAGSGTSAGGGATGAAEGAGVETTVSVTGTTGSGPGALHAAKRRGTMAARIGYRFTSGPTCEAYQGGGYDGRMSPVRFHLAPMTLDLRIMTWGLFVIPVAMLWGALSVPLAPARNVLLGTAVFVVILYASIWLAWRPSSFVLDAGGLAIAWPARSRAIPRDSIAAARIVTKEEFRREFGYGMRIGAGGLWGGFGLLKTGRETFSMWISRTDRFVLVSLRDARTLMLTPNQPERFVEAVHRLVG